MMHKNFIIFLKKRFVLENKKARGAPIINEKRVVKKAMAKLLLIITNFSFKEFMLKLDKALPISLKDEPKTRIRGRNTIIKNKNITIE